MVSKFLCHQSYIKMFNKNKIMEYNIFVVTMGFNLIL